MWETVKNLLGSKKALVAVLSVAAAIAALFGFELPIEQVAVIVGPLWLYIFAGQHRRTLPSHRSPGKRAARRHRRAQARVGEARFLRLRSRRPR